MPVYIEGSKNPEMFAEIVKEMIYLMKRSSKPERFAIVEAYGVECPRPDDALGAVAEGCHCQDSNACAVAHRAARDNGWTYVEGIAFFPGSPLPWMHAWCVDQQGQVKELTWLKPGDYYFGVPFKKAIIWQTAPLSLIWDGNFTLDTIGRHVDKVADPPF